MKVFKFGTSYFKEDWQKLTKLAWQASLFNVDNVCTLSGDTGGPEHRRGQEVYGRWEERAGSRIPKVAGTRRNRHCIIFCNRIGKAQRGGNHNWRGRNQEYKVWVSSDPPVPPQFNVKPFWFYKEIKNIQKVKIKQLGLVKKMFLCYCNKLWITCLPSIEIFAFQNVHFYYIHYIKTYSIQDFTIPSLG